MQGFSKYSAAAVAVFWLEKLNYKQLNKIKKTHQVQKIQ